MAHLAQGSKRRNAIRWILLVLVISGFGLSYIFFFGGVGQIGRSSQSSSTQSSEHSTSTSNGPNFPLRAVATIPVAWASEMAYDSSNGNLYVSSLDGSVSVISGTNNTIIARIELDHEAPGIIYDPWNRFIYVSQSCGSGSSEQTGIAAVVIDGANNSIVKRISGPCAQGDFAYVPSLHHLYQTQASGGVNVIDDRNNSVVVGSGIGGTGRTIAYDSANQVIYTGDTDSVDTTPIDGGPSGTIQVPGANPSVRSVPVVAYNPVTNEIYIGTQRDNPLIGTYSGQYFYGYVFDRTRNYYFMSMVSCGTERCQYEVVVFNAANNTVLGRISVGDVLAGLAYDPTNHYLYVANRSSNGSVIAVSIN